MEFIWYNLDSEWMWGDIDFLSDLV
jgi:hypothetical protein